ncbi:hypothetical protein PLICRDRAFT_125453 [Plicaturopsis crispa FD-325 SS-3]|nr:hypothetical protein PLICRDRAFT_125453 [Plicaturopsis crispa FD-325 SS-3]
MSLCQNCVKGVRHEGTPTGKFETIGGVRTYVATPTTEYSKDTAILFLPGAFGLELSNNPLLADDFANNGFLTVIPDYLNGDSVPTDALALENFDVAKWIQNHGPAQTRPPLDAVIAALKADGITKLGAVGYCFGGRYVFDLAFDDVIQVSVVNHPSLLEAPGDLQKYRDVAKAPLLINSCELDDQYTFEKQKIGDEILGDGKYAPGYERNYFAGCEHGFAVRGDLSNPLVKAGKEGAFKSAVQWFRKYL